MSTIPIPAAEPIALQPGEGERRWFHGFLITIKSSAETTNGRVAVVEHLGWVEEWDDDGELFLITFAASQPTPRASVEEEDDLPFQLEREASSGRKTTAPTRPGQHRFSYRVLRRYGSMRGLRRFEQGAARRRAAARLPGQAERRSRNGLVLCATHHRAFDQRLFAIQPTTHDLVNRDGAGSLGMTRKSVAHLPALPHPEALAWCWSRFQSASG